MKWHIVIVVAAATILALLWFGSDPDQDRTTENQPVLYYTKGLVEQYDSTPRGSYELYRIVGLDGQPELVFSDRGNSYLPPPLTRDPYFVTRPHNYISGAVEQGFPAFYIGVKADGSRSVIDSGIPPTTVTGGPESKIVSPDDRYLVTSAVECVDEAEDRPCITAPVVKLYDYDTGKIQTYDQRARDDQNLLGTRAVPLFLSSEKLLIDYEGQQERSAQYYYLIDLETGQAALKYSNAASNEVNYEVLSAIDEQTVLARRWQLSSDGPPAAIVKFNFIDNTAEIVDQFPDGDQPTYDFPITADGYFFTPEYSQGLKYRDIQNHTTITLIDNGEARAVSADRRYAVMFEPYTDSGGYGSGKLVWWDFQQNKSRVIYDQRFGSGLNTNINANPTPGLKVGDSIYGFVSLEIDGVGVMKNALGI